MDVTYRMNTRRHRSGEKLHEEHHRYMLCAVTELARSSTGFKGNLQHASGVLYRSQPFQ